MLRGAATFVRSRRCTRMSRKDTILLATDFAPTSKRSVDFAARLARALNASVLVLYVDALHASESDEIDLKSSDPLLSIDWVKEQLEGVARRLRALGIEAETRCRYSVAVAATILAVAEEEGVRAIVASKHGTRGMRRFLLGSVSDELLRMAQHPLVLVPHDSDGGTGDIRRLLVPIDFSPSTDHQIAEAQRLFPGSDLQVELLHVDEPLPLPLLMPESGTLSDLVPSLGQEIEQQLQRHADVFRRNGAATNTRVVRGRPGPCIVDVADESGADLILLARHGHSKVERLLLGSITEHVTRTARTPVLIFPNAAAERVGKRPA